MFKHYINKLFRRDIDKDAQIRALQERCEELEGALRREGLKQQAVAAVPKIPAYQRVPVAGFDSIDCEPQDSKERENYIADVDSFFDSVLRDKLKVSIAEIREVLARINSNEAAQLGLTREQYDFYMRGMEGMAWKMHDWCELLQGERRKILQEQENNK